MNCLLIETKDRRKFLTHEKHFLQLVEFSKMFNAEISVVKLNEGRVLELEDLAPAICNPNYKESDAIYEIISTKMPVKTRTEILKIADKVQKFILDKFMNEEVVCLDDLRKQFKKFKLSDAALCNHVRRAKEVLEKEGFQFVKLGTGKYKKSNV